MIKIIIPVLLFSFHSQITMANVKHFVAFKFKPTVTATQKRDVFTKFLKLKDECYKNGERYIISIEAGLANSKEGFDQKFSQGYIVTFKSLEDRDYYVGKPFSKDFDPAHESFKQFVGPLLSVNSNAKVDGVFVFDYSAE